MPKPKIYHKETFKENVCVDKNEIINILNDNDNAIVEIKNRGIMSNNEEFITIKIKIPKE
jgi:hypothetical protein